MQDQFMGGFSLSNLRGTNLAVALLVTAAIFLMAAQVFVFRGSVQL